MGTETGTAERTNWEERAVALAQGYARVMRTSRLRLGSMPLSLRALRAQEQSQALRAASARRVGACRHKH